MLIVTVKGSHTMPTKKTGGIFTRDPAIDSSSFKLLIALIAVTLVLLLVLACAGCSALLSIDFLGKLNGVLPSGGNSDNPFYEKNEIDIPFDLENAATISADSINSERALLVDVTADKIVASKKNGGNPMIYPASLTKIMTLIVVVENLKSESDLDHVLTIEDEPGEHSGFGFKIGEKLTVRDLLYATILYSDGLACLTLAKYIAGSEAAFVKLMNQKVKDLGLLEGDPETNPSTNFINCTGLHDTYHYSTCYDMAVITAYAMENTLCSSVFNSLSYKPSSSFRPGEGPFTFWHQVFAKRLNYGEKQPNNAEILGTKSGWTGRESGYCMAYYIKGDDGHYYVLITSNATETQSATGWDNAINDAFYICDTYINAN